MVMVGDDVPGTVMPERHVSRWLLGPQRWRPMHLFAEHPGLARVLSAAEAAVGL
ncbi:hypothetical protein ACIBOV_28260 [Micromonospora chersina]|uniref:hypothetical protein n=1 Tax=Micromonospora chersina TaxID=47854 RepID=UPI0037B1F922